MTRRTYSIYARRKRMLGIFIITWSLLMMTLMGQLCRLSTEALMPIVPASRVNEDLEHYRRSSNLKHYLDNIKLLIEPSKSPCLNLEEVPLIAMVASRPRAQANRNAIRQAWGQHQPTYFVMGLDRTSDDQLITNYMEAKQYDDIVVYDFLDHYQNLTVKTALMLHWTLQRCPTAQYMMKVDDDVLINPWVLKQVIKDHDDAALIGYQRTDVVLSRKRDLKWYVPRWLYWQDVVPKFLTGHAYLVNGDYIRKLLKAAYKAPMINNEDMFFTHLVASSLRYTLDHDSRLNQERPMLLWPTCAYWAKASFHPLTPEDMADLWPRLKALAKEYESGKVICDGVFTWILVYLLGPWFVI